MRAKSRSSGTRICDDSGSAFSIRCGLAARSGEQWQDRLMHQFPVFLNLRGRTVVLVGEGEAADAKARLIVRAGGRIVQAWGDGGPIAFVALDDEPVASTAERLGGKEYVSKRRYREAP